MHCYHLIASISEGIVEQPVGPGANMVELAPPRAELLDPVESIDSYGATATVSDTAQRSATVTRLRAGSASFASFEQLVWSLASPAASASSTVRLFQPFWNGMAGTLCSTK